MRRPEQVPPARGFEHSLVYREFMAEQEEIQRLKWLESEKRGADIGISRAVLYWTTRHRLDWCKHRRFDGRSCA